MGEEDYMGTLCTILGKEMATHSRILVWRIPWTEEPGGLQSMGSQRVRHDLVSKTTTVLSVQLLCKSKTILKLKFY